MPGLSPPPRGKGPKNKYLVLCSYKFEQTGDRTDHLELLDYFIRMQKVFDYRDIPRHVQMEEENLKKMEWCEPFKAKIAPQVCMLRRKYDTAGYCDHCKGTKKPANSE